MFRETEDEDEECFENEDEDEECFKSEDEDEELGETKGETSRRELDLGRTLSNGVLSVIIHSVYRGLIYKVDTRECPNKERSDNKEGGDNIEGGVAI